MRKFSKLVVLFLCCFLIFQAHAQSLVLVKGKMEIERVKTVHLFQVIEGKKVEYASTKLDKMMEFAFAILNPKEGFYYLSTQEKHNFTPVYLKAGEQITLNFNDTGYVLKTGSEENKVLYEWTTMAKVITVPSLQFMAENVTYETFFPELISFLPEATAFQKKINTKNKSFNELMKLAVDTDIEEAALVFLLTPRSKHPKKSDYPAYYSKVIQPNKYCNARLLELGNAYSLIRNYVDYCKINTDVKEISQKADPFAWEASLFCNDTIKGLYVSNALSRFKTYEELTKAIEPVRQCLITDSMQTAYFKALKSLSDLKKGSPAYNFSYPDHTGKKVSLQELKGKVVLVDVWATWCIPCKKEVPYMKKLEEELHGKNIEFVSISIDHAKDKEKWLAMIEKEKLSGTQLFANGWSEIVSFYNINSVPRFMVFDQNGKIVSIDAPNPSDPELKSLLLKVESGAE